MTSSEKSRNHSNREVEHSDAGERIPQRLSLRYVWIEQSNKGPKRDSRLTHSPRIKNTTASKTSDTHSFWMRDCSRNWRHAEKKLFHPPWKYDITLIPTWSLVLYKQNSNPSVGLSLSPYKWKIQEWLRNHPKTEITLNLTSQVYKKRWLVLLRHRRPELGALDRKFIGSPSPSRQNCCNELWPIRLLGLPRKDLDLPHSVHLVHGGCGSVRTSGPDGYSSQFLTKTVSSLDIDYSLSSHNLNPRFQTLQDSMRGLVHSFVLFLWTYTGFL